MKVKRISLLLAALIITTCAVSSVFASGDTQEMEEVTITSTSQKGDDQVELSNASKTTHKNLTSKEEDIQRYTKQLGGKRTNGVVLYYLKLVQSYSIPVCFVGLVIASLNFFIIGNKKLDKREQGFKMLVTLIVGLIVFQVLPLLFAIIVAGRWYTNEGSFCNRKCIIIRKYS